MLKHDRRFPIEEGVVSPNEGVERPSLGLARVAVVETGEIEGEAPDLLDAVDPAVGDDVHQVQAFEGHHPASGLLHPVGDGPEDGLEVIGREAEPLADPVDVAAVEGGVVVAGGADDGLLDVGVAEGGAAGEIGLPEAVLILQCAGGPSP